MKMMFMGRVSLCEREMSKRMENKEKSEKRIRKSEKERKFGFGSTIYMEIA